MTKLTLNQAFSVYTTVEQLSGQRFPSKVSYWLAYTKRKLSAVVESFTETRRQRALDLDVVTNDAIDENKPNYQLFVDEMTALSGEDAGEDFRNASTDIFAATTIAPGALVHLLPLLDDATTTTFTETELDFGQVVDLCDVLAAELAHPHPFSASYVMARVFDVAMPATSDYRTLRLSRGREIGTVDPSGRVRNDHPAFPAYLSEMQTFIKERGKIVLRHPVVKPSLFDGDDFPPAVFDVLWFIFDES